jgi:hypothetical protein
VCFRRRIAKVRDVFFLSLPPGRFGDRKESVQLSTIRATRAPNFFSIASSVIDPPASSMAS